MIIFDLDDTLAESKSAISARCATALGRLLDEVQVCIISGGRFAQFQTQVLDHLDLPARRSWPAAPDADLRDPVLPLQRRGLALTTPRTSARTKARIIEVLTEGAHEPRPAGTTRRGATSSRIASQITFSALGQGAPVAAKTAWDPDGSKKGRLRAWAADRLPGLEVRSGGSTSIDVTREGIDKAYGVAKLMDHVGLGPTTCCSSATASTRTATTTRSSDGASIGRGARCSADRDAAAPPAGTALVSRLQSPRTSPAEADRAAHSSRYGQVAQLVRATT